MELKVDGMTCSHCSSAVKQALESVEGVQEASVDLEAGRARVTGTPELAALIRVIEDEGYRASPASS